MTENQTQTYWQIAARVCTPKQLRILELRDRYGFSYRLISLTTSVSIWTVRTQLHAARVRVDKALTKEAAA